MIISFMGNDGSGKTTTSLRLKKFFDDMGLNTEYRRTFAHFILRRFTNSKNSVQIKPEKKSSLWYFVIWLDMLLEFLWLRTTKTNKVIIMDRYAFDYFMSIKWHDNESYLIRKLFENFPKPDISFVMDVDPKIAQERKKGIDDYFEKFYSVQRDRYLSLATNTNSHILQSKERIEFVLEKAIEKITFSLLQKLRPEDALASLISISSKNFREEITKLLNTELNWDYLIDRLIVSGTEVLVSNNLLSQFDYSLNQPVKTKLKKLLQESEKRTKAFKATVKKIDSLLTKENIDYVIMKTIQPFPSTPTDIDLLVERNNFDKVRGLIEAGQSIRESKIHNAMTIGGDTLMPIDLHFEISWLKRKVIDSKTVLKHKKKIYLDDDVSCYVPSDEDEILICAAHATFQHHYLLGSDILNVGIRMQKNLDMKYMLKHSEKFNWSELFKYFISRTIITHNMLNENSLTTNNLKAYENLSPEKLKPVQFYPMRMVPKEDFFSYIDFIQTIYRKLRYSFNGKLGFSLNWLVNS